MSNPKKQNILIVDDNYQVRDALKLYLEKVGMHPVAVSSGDEMMNAMEKTAFDLIILDVLLPGESGLSLLNKLRSTNKVPVIIISALDSETDRIIGLELGADDYVSKPFNPREVTARIRAILKRNERPSLSLGGTNGNSRIGFGTWLLHTDRRTIEDQNGHEEMLTVADFQLLMAFLSRPRAILSRDKLLDLTSARISGPFDRAIDNQVSRLRKKIEKDPGRPELIITVRGGGYCLVADVIRSDEDHNPAWFSG